MRVTTGDRMVTRLPTTVRLPLGATPEAATFRLRELIDTGRPIGPDNCFGESPILEGYAHGGAFRVRLQRQMGGVRQGSDFFRVVADGRIEEMPGGSCITARVELLDGALVRAFRLLFLMAVVLFSAFAALFVVAGTRGTAPAWVFVLGPLAVAALTELGFRVAYVRARREAALLITALGGADETRSRHGTGPPLSSL